MAIGRAVVQVVRMVVSTYQAASGAGQAAMDELQLQTKQVLEGKEVTMNIFPLQVMLCSPLLVHDQEILQSSSVWQQWYSSSLDSDSSNSSSSVLVLLVATWKIAAMVANKTRIQPGSCPAQTL